MCVLVSCDGAASRTCRQAVVPSARCYTLDRLRALSSVAARLCSYLRVSFSALYSRSPSLPAQFAPRAMRLRHTDEALDVHIVKYHYFPKVLD